MTTASRSASPAHPTEGLSDDKRALNALAEAVHRGRFPSDREPTPFGELGIGETAYCYRIAKSVQQALSAAPSDGWVLVPREPTPEMTAAGRKAFATLPLTLDPSQDPSRVARTYRAMLSAAPERVEGGGWA